MPFEHYVDVFLASAPKEEITSLFFADSTLQVSDVRSRLGQISHLRFDAAALKKIVFLNKAKQTVDGPIRDIRDDDRICDIATYEDVADDAALPADRTPDGQQDGSRDPRLILAYRSVYEYVDPAWIMRMTD